MEVGKDADILLWSVQPALDVGAKVRRPIVDGKVAFGG